MSKLLEFIYYCELSDWSVKQYLNSSFSSKYKIVLLKNYIREEKNKIKPFEFPDNEFGILGVSNKIGLFDNEIRKGREINQAYKKVENGFLTYNPYRINVGSIGLKTNKQKYNLISPAYVVFSCKDDLLPEYLFLIFKTKIFNKIINESTRGSVRQILAFDILETLKIPLPPLQKQKEIVNAYQSKIALAEKQEQEAKEKEKEIEEYLYRELGIEITKKEDKTNGLLEFINSKDLRNWSYEQVNSNSIFSCDSNIKCNITTLENMCIFKKKPFNKKEYKKSTFNYVDIGSIDPFSGIVEAKEINIAKAPSRATQYINTGDLIIATTRPYLKKFAIVDDKFDNNICSSGFSILEYNPSKYNLEFVKEFLQSFYGIEQLKEKMTGGLYPAITLSELKSVMIPHPNVEIQKKIVLYINILKEKIKTLKKQAQQNRTSALQEFEKEIFNEA